MSSNKFILTTHKFTANYVGKPILASGTLMSIPAEQDFKKINNGNTIKYYKWKAVLLQSVVILIAPQNGQTSSPYITWLFSYHLKKQKELKLVRKQMRLITKLWSKLHQLKVITSEIAQHPLRRDSFGL